MTGPSSSKSMAATQRVSRRSQPPARARYHRRAAPLLRDAARRRTPMTTYSLGSADPELARLEAQAEFLREPTRMLLAASGLRPGMRVLDLGTGLGHVAAAVADVVGPDGDVVGVDKDTRMLARA